VGWKPNFKISNQSFSSTYQNKQNHELPTCMKVEKKKKKLEKKIGGKGLKNKKLQDLPLHWFLTNDSTTTNTSSITIENTMFSKSQ
jgi:hypothetical protein